MGRRMKTETSTRQVALIVVLSLVFYAVVFRGTDILAYFLR